MKNKLTFSASLVAVAAALSWMAWPGNAGMLRAAPLSNSEVVPADEVLGKVRASGLSPVGRIVRRGDYYVVHAIDPRGIEVRVVTDALFGDILSVSAARPVVPAYAARYDSGPRIIHIPDRITDQSRAHQSRAMQPYDDAALTDDDDAPVAAVPKRRRAGPGDEALAPLPRHRQAAPAPEFKPRRSVLNVPPPAIDGPTPIKPTPRWRSAEKFTAPPAVPPVVPQVDAVPPPAADAPAVSAPVPMAAEPLASADPSDMPPEGPTLDLRSPDAPPAAAQ